MLSFFDFGNQRAKLENDLEQVRQELLQTKQELQLTRTQAGRFDRTLSAIPAPMFLTDKNLVITWINDPALAAMGYSREEVVAKMTCGE